MLYAFSLGLESYIYHNMYVMWFSMVVALILVMLSCNRIPKLQRSDILVAIMLLFILCDHNANILRGDYTDAVDYIFIFILYWLLSSYNLWQRSLLYVIATAGVFYAIMTIVCKYSPSFFHNFVYPLFASFGYGKELINDYKEGFIPGFTPHTSANGMYLTIGLGATITSLFSRLTKKKIINVILSILILYALLLTGKRGDLIFAVAGAFLVYYVNSADHKYGRIIKVIGIAIIVSVILVVFANFIPVLNNFLLKFQLAEQNSGDIMYGRIIIWAQAALSFQKNYLLGIGWDGFKYYYLQNFHSFLNVHMVYLQLLCEVGILGSISFFTFFALNFYKCLTCLSKMRKLKLLTNSITERILAFALFVQTYFLLYSLSGNPLYDKMVLFPYICSCAVGSYYYLNLQKSLNQKKLSGGEL